MNRAYIELDKENIIVGWSLERYSDNAIEIDYPKDFYGKLGFIKYINGVLSVDEEKKEEQSKDVPTVNDVVKTVDKLEQNTQDMHKKITQGQSDISAMQDALVEVYEMLQNEGSEEENG